MELIHKDLTDELISIFYEVYNTLGYGFLEKVYHNAMLIEFRNRNIIFESEKEIEVYYKGYNVGIYFADIVIENKIIIELKASEFILKENEYQLINYLRSTDIEVGLLFNFGKNAEFKRKVYTNKNQRRAKINDKMWN